MAAKRFVRLAGKGLGALIAASGVLALVGCSTVSSVLPDRRAEYKRSNTLSALEVPPDLTSSSIDDNLVVPELGPAGTASYSDYSRERAPGTLTAEQLLPQPDSARIERNGTFRWLVVRGEPKEVWKLMRSFWEDSGFVIEREDPATGVLETAWAENRADIPEGPVRSLLGRAMENAYSAPTRDKFRLRIEHGGAVNTTEVYLTHYGVSEVQKSAYEIVWQARPRDPELEAEMLRRIMLYIGVSEERSRALLADRPDGDEPKAAVIVGADGQRMLTLEEPVAKSWRLVGIALEGSYFRVEDRDPILRIYTVRYTDPLAEQESGGLLSKLAFWSDEPDDSIYRVQLAQSGPGSTRISVTDDDGIPSNSEAASKILMSLEEQLR